jgi:hypothetical protein
MSAFGTKRQPVEAWWRMGLINLINGAAPRDMSNPLLAQSGHPSRSAECPLLEIERT